LVARAAAEDKALAETARLLPTGIASASVLKNELRSYFVAGTFFGGGACALRISIRCFSQLSALFGATTIPSF
jgi:hypothetical protein